MSGCWSSVRKGGWEERAVPGAERPEPLLGGAAPGAWVSLLAWPLPLLWLFACSHLPSLRCHLPAHQARDLSGPGHSEPPGLGVPARGLQAWFPQQCPAEALGDGVSQMHRWQGPGPRPELPGQPSASRALPWSGLRASLSTAGTRSHLGQTQWTALWPFWEQPGCRSCRPRIRSPLPPPAGRGQ